MDSVKQLFLEAESDRDDNYRPFSSDIVGQITNVDFNKVVDYIKIDFTTTYKKPLSLLSKLTDFKKWLSDYKSKGMDNDDMFKQFVKDFAGQSKESVDVEIGVNEIIDKDNQIIPDDSIPPNTTNSHIGLNHTMDLEKIFKRSMPKSVRNYSGNLGLGSVIW